MHAHPVIASNRTKSTRLIAIGSFVFTAFVSVAHSSLAAPPATTVTTVPTAATAPVAAAIPATAPTTTQSSRAAVPDAGAQGAAARLVREVYHDDLAQAKGRPQKVALAGKLAQAGIDESRDVAARFMLPSNWPRRTLPHSSPLEFRRVIPPPVMATSTAAPK